MTDIDVAVIGAGLSGLIAARDVEQAGARVVVIEGADRVGGKTWTCAVGTDHVDLGARWIGPKHHRVRLLARQLGLHRRRQRLRGRQLLLIGGRTVTVKSEVPQLGPRVLTDLAYGSSKLWWLYRNTAFDKQSLQRWSSKSGTELCRWAFRTSDARDFLRLAVELLLGTHPDDISAEHLLKYLKSGGGLVFLSVFSYGAQQWSLIGGAQQLSLRLAASLSGEVVLGQRVDAVSQDSSGVVIRAGEREWHARRAIFAVSPPRLNDITFAPALPAAISEYAKESKLGVYSKFVAVYDRAWWRDDGFSGNVHMTEGPLRMIIDTSGQSGRGILVGFAVAREAAELIDKPAAERRAAALEAIAAPLGAAALTPIDFVEVHWSQDEFARGAPSAFLPPNASSSSVLPPRPDRHLFWAGTDVAVEFNGYLEGAIESGARAAEQALATLAAG